MIGPPDLSKRHNSPHDRGESDAYYQRPYDPHRYLRMFNDSDAGAQRVALTHPAEIRAYSAAFDDETDRKDWG